MSNYLFVLRLVLENKLTYLLFILNFNLLTKYEQTGNINFIQKYNYKRLFIHVNVFSLLFSIPQSYACNILNDSQPPPQKKIFCRRNINSESKEI